MITLHIYSVDLIVGASEWDDYSAWTVLARNPVEVAEILEEDLEDLEIQKVGVVTADVAKDWKAGVILAGGQDL